MAITTIITPQWASNAPRIKLTLEPKSENHTDITYELKVYYVASYAASSSNAKNWSVTFDGATKNGTFNINGKTGTHLMWTGTNTVRKRSSSFNLSATVAMSFNLTWSGVYGGTKSASGTVTIPSVIFYRIGFDPNGGSGIIVPISKEPGKPVKIPTTKPTRTGYTFQGWSTSRSGAVAYRPGDNYTADASGTLYAVWKINTWTVAYNANGGSGAPSSQTKTYGITLKLSSTKPTRKYYTFKGWSASKTATTATYAAGGDYTSNSSVTLYAVWELSYVVPRINNPTVQRCDMNGTPLETGTYVLVEFGWACDKTVSSIKMEWKLSSSSTFENSTTVSASGTSGNVSVVIGSGLFDIDLNYDIQITVTDTIDSSAVTRSIASIYYIMDILRGGKGLAFGKVAELDDVMDVDFQTLFRKEAQFKSTVKDRFNQPDGNGLCSYNSSNHIDPNTTLEHIILTNKNTPMTAGGGFMYIHTYFYSTKSTSTNRMQVAYPYSSNGSEYHRYYHNGAWTAWRRHANADEFNNYLVQVSFDKDNISIAKGSSGNIDIPVSRDGYNCIGVTGLNITNASSSGFGSSSANITQFYANTGSAVVKVFVNNIHETNAIKIRIRGNALFYKIPT